MTDKKLSIADMVFLVILCGLLPIFFGCSSAPKKIERPTYECPSCGYKVDASSVNKNIRMENICQSCGEKFFYTHVAESNKAGNYQPGYYGRRIYGPSSSYQSDVNYQRFGVGGYSFKETSTGFSELSWYFHDSKVKSYRAIPRWTNTRHHYP